MGAIFSKQKDNSVIHCFLEKGSGGEVRFSTLIHALTALPSDPNVILTIFPLLLSHCSTDNAPGHFEHFTGVNCFYCSEIHITELTILTDTIQWHLVHAQCSTITTSYQVPKHFHHPTAVTPHCCLAPAPGKHQSTFYLSGLASCEHWYLPIPCCRVYKWEVSLATLSEEGKQGIHWGGLGECSWIFSMPSAGNMVQEKEYEENENEPDKNSFLNVYFRERLVID